MLFRSKPNSYTADTTQGTGTNFFCRSFTLKSYEANTIVEFLSCFTEQTQRVTLENYGDIKDICALDFPVVVQGRACMSCNTFSEYRITYTGKQDDTFAEYTVMIPSGLSCYDISDCDTCTKQYTTLGQQQLQQRCCGESTLITGRFNIIEKYTDPDSRRAIVVLSIIPPQCIGGDCSRLLIEKTRDFDKGCAPLPLNAFSDTDSKYRMVFNSPETSFGQPFLGNVLKLESVIYGAGKAHNVEVKDNAKYRLLSEQAQRDALTSSDTLAGETDPFNIGVFFAAYQAYLAIYLNGISKKNFAYSFNSIASYNYSGEIIDNAGIKQRPIDIAQYLIPGVQAVGDDNPINNYNRESSVYIKTTDEVRNFTIPYITYEICNTEPSQQPFNFALFSITNPTTLQTETVSIPAGQCRSFDSTTTPLNILPYISTTITYSDIKYYTADFATPPLNYPTSVPSISPTGFPIVYDRSRYTISEKSTCDVPEKQDKIDVLSYYASLKNIFVNQWGQMYSYETIDTGFQRLLTKNQNLPSKIGRAHV